MNTKRLLRLSISYSFVWFHNDIATAKRECQNGSNASSIFAKVAFVNMKFVLGRKFSIYYNRLISNRIDLRVVIVCQGQFNEVEIQNN